MPLANQLNLDWIVADNTSLTGADIPIAPGSDLRLILAVTAIAGAPAGNIIIQGKTRAGDYVALIQLSAAAAGQFTGVAENCPDTIRYFRGQAGGVNTLTMSADLIIRPPTS